MAEARKPARGQMADDWVKLVAAGIDPVEAASRVGYKRPDHSARQNLRNPSVVERLEAAKRELPDMPLPEKRHVDIIQERRSRAYEMWLQGHKLREIAESLNYNVSTAWFDVRWMMREQARLDGVTSLQALRQRLTLDLLQEVELAHISEVEAKAAEDYRAASAYQSNRQRAIDSIARINGLDKLEVEVTHQVSFLAVIRQAMEAQKQLGQ